jgi:hypothetical protein
MGRTASGVKGIELDDSSYWGWNHVRRRCHFNSY